MKSLARWLFQFIARGVLRRHRPVVIAVAGSIGKTATKEAVAASLEPSRRVRKTVGSFNAEIGVPVTIIAGGAARKTIFGWLAVFVRGVWLCLRRSPDYPELLVLELGTDRPGDLAPLLRLAKPNISILTAIAPEHLEFFGDLDAVAQEEWQVIQALTAEATAIVNIDDEQIRTRLDGLAPRVIRFGQSAAADVRLVHQEITLDGLGRPTGQVIKTEVSGSVIPIGLTGVIGAHQANPILAALAVHQALGLPLSAAVEGVKRYHAPPGRMRVYPGVGECGVIDDSYNASPAAMAAALRTLRDLPIRGRRVAILGQMSELGASATYWHDLIGEHAAAAKLDQLVTIGDLADRIGAAAIARGLPADRVKNVKTPAAAAALLATDIRSGDIILVKGSRYPKPGYAGFVDEAVRLLAPAAA